MNFRQLIRFAIALGLTYGVYTEAGIWTALAILLIFGEIENGIFEINRIRFITSGIAAIIFKDDFEKEHLAHRVSGEGEML